MKAKNIITINGVAYDAKSGQKINKPSAKARRTISSLAVNNSNINSTRPAKSQPKNITVKVADSEANSSARRAQSNVHTKLQRSATLHRRSVKVPNIKATAKDVKPKTIYPAKAKQQTLDSRLQRAKATVRSQSIQRFATPNTTPKDVVRQKTPTSRPVETKTQSVKSSSAAPSVNHHSGDRRKVQASDLFGHSNLKPKANRTHKPIKSKRNYGNFAVGALAALTLSAYVAYLNVPMLSMKVAAHRAGFAATIPADRPSGYSLNGPISYARGLVTINFRSNTDQRNFAIKQQVTNWDSNAMVENLFNSDSNNYTAYQDGGLTIYLHKNGDASWVNGGKLNTIQAKNSDLAPSQILDLATSM